MAFGYGPTSWLDQASATGTGPGGQINLGLDSAPRSGDGSSLLFDSDGYPVSIGPDDWPFVSALGLDTYSRLGRMLGSGQGSGDAGAWAPTSAEAPSSITPPPATSVAVGAQPVAATRPADLSNLTPFVGPQLSAQGGANALPGLNPPPPAMTATRANAVAPVASVDTSTLTGLPGFPVEQAYWAQPGDSAWQLAQQTYGADDLNAGFEALVRSNRLGLTKDGVPIIDRGQQLTLPDLSDMDARTRSELSHAGGQRLAQIAQMAAARQGPPDWLSSVPPWGASASQPPAPLPTGSPFIPFEFNDPQGPPPGGARIGPPPRPLPYFEAALRDGDRGYQDAMARFREVFFPSTVQQAIQSVLDPGGVNHISSALALGAEPGGDFAGGLFRPVLPDDPRHPGRQALRDFIGETIVNLPGAADGEGEAAEASALRGGIYEFPDLWAADGRTYVGQTHDLDAGRPSHWVAVGRADPAAIRIREVPGGREAREIAEHNRIQEITGGQRARNSSAVSNQRDPIGAARRNRLGIPHPRE